MSEKSFQQDISPLDPREKEMVQDEAKDRVARERMIECLKYSNLREAIEIRDAFSIPQDFFESVYKEILVRALQRGDFVTVSWYFSKLNLSKEFIQSIDIQSAIKKGVLRKLREDFYFYNETFVKFRDSFSASEAFQSAAMEFLNSLLESEFFNSSRCVGIVKKFNLPHEVVQQVAKKWMLYHIKYCRIDRFIEIQNTFNVPQEFSQSSEVQFVAREEIINCLKFFKEEHAVKIIEKLRVNFSNDNFQEILDSGDLRSVLRLLVFFPDLKGVYDAFIQKQKDIILGDEGRVNLKQKNVAIKTLKALIDFGDLALVIELAKIITLRSQSGEHIDSKTGLTSVQEAAFAILRKLDNPEANEALFSLLANDSIPHAVKRSVMIKLSGKDSSFLDSSSRADFREMLAAAGADKAKKIDWNDFGFFEAIKNIHAAQTRQAVRSSASLTIKNLMLYTTQGAYQTWQEKYPDISQEAFLACGNLVQESPEEFDEVILGKINGLFRLAKKESTKKEALLSAVVGARDLWKHPDLFDRLREIDFGGKKEDIDDFIGLLRAVAIFDSIDQGHFEDNDQEDYGEEYEEQEVKKQPAASTELFYGKFDNLKHLRWVVQEAISKKYQEILPYQEITAERMVAVEEQWEGNIEPILTYTRRYPRSRGYIAEIVAHTDSTERWQAWRYDLSKKVVRGSLGNLSGEQRQIWQGNYAAEVGDVMMAQSAVDKPRHIRTLLIEAVVSHNHIFNPEAGFNKNEAVHNTLKPILLEASQTPDRSKEIIDQALERLEKEAGVVNKLLRATNLPKLEQAMGETEAGKKWRSTKTKGVVDLLMPFLDKAVAEVLLDNYRKAEETTKETGQPIKAETVFTDAIYQAFAKTVDEIEQEAKALLGDAATVERLGLKDLKNPGPLYAKRQELKVAIDLLHICNLSNKLIATNRLSEKARKKEGGQTIYSVLEGLKKHFNGTPLHMDLQNVEASLKEHQEFGEKRRLAMVFSDHSQLLWQAGKYPLGCGSCQNYSEGSMAQALMGYVGDAHNKVAYLVDINAMPAATSQAIDSGQSVEEALLSASRKDLLEAVLARSIIKLGTSDGRPTLFLEPTYSSVNKGDASMDRYFNLFIDLFVSGPMGAQLASGVGHAIIKIPKSRSPQGQYEDGAEGNAQHGGMGIQHGVYEISANIISKEHTPTKEEQEIVERMRNSSVGRRAEEAA